MIDSHPTVKRSQRPDAGFETRQLTPHQNCGISITSGLSQSFTNLDRYRPGASMPPPHHTISVRHSTLPLAASAGIAACTRARPCRGFPASESASRSIYGAASLSGHPDFSPRCRNGRRAILRYMPILQRWYGIHGAVGALSRPSAAGSGLAASSGFTAAIMLIVGCTPASGKIRRQRVHPQQRLVAPASGS